MKNDIRWLQRFDNFKKAYKRLATAIKTIQTTPTNNNDEKYLMQEGLIQCFEYTHELAWNVMKDYETFQGDFEIRGSRDAIRKALAIGIIDDPTWMESISDRNRTSHNYDEETATEIHHNIINIYFPLFTHFKEKMEEIEKEEIK